MKIAPLPLNESERLKALIELEVMDSNPETEFNDIVALASRICETPISLITLIDERRQWFKAKVGLETMETSRNVAFCAHAILGEKIFEVGDALLDDRFYDNPLVTSKPDIRFYAGMPLTTSSGYKLGTLCVIDTVPRQLNAIQIQTLEVLSNQVVKQLEIRIDKRKIEQQSLALKKLNESNAKLLSIIGHDLRSPLASLHQIIEMSNSGDLSPDETISLVQESGLYVDGSLSLLDNLISWAKQQFQNEEILSQSVPIKKVLEQICRDFSLKIEAKSNELIINSIEDSVVINENVFRLLVRNLIANANKFTQSGEIQIDAKVEGSFLQVSVTDTGTGMNETQIQNLFSWEKRRSTTGTSGEKGLGIGLQLCKEMIDAEGGKLFVESKPGHGTAFYFTLPIR